jgi:hypothetical protein
MYVRVGIWLLASACFLEHCRGAGLQWEGFRIFYKAHCGEECRIRIVA